MWFQFYYERDSAWMDINIWSDTACGPSIAKIISVTVLSAVVTDIIYEGNWQKVCIFIYIC